MHAHFNTSFVSFLFLSFFSTSSSLTNNIPTMQPSYPGTAVVRMLASRARVRSLTKTELESDWDSVTRPKILWAAGLKDIRNADPGNGYTG